MKTKLFVLLMLVPLSLQAQFLQKGYRGMVDVGYCLYISQIAPTTIELTTSHGYQFNPYIFLGGGVGFDFTGECKWGDINGKPYNKRVAKVDIPIFINGRANLTKTKISPFVDARVGAYINNGGNIYANLALGGRYAINERIGVSLSVGYEIRKVTVEEIHMITGTKHNNYKIEYYYTDRPDQSVDGFVFKVGVDF
ncbi:MAG: hypothetical protein K6E14_01150 [Paludibacteraceae bacterium]|nr:hypothetical protein [Paludibacteraceae bacterium]